jgi:hypothetical protein
MARALTACTLLVGIAALAACTVKETPTPALAGPSELGLSLSLQASPDVLVQDGESQTHVVIQARNVNGQPVPNLPLRVEILHRGSLVDFGRLSPSRNLATGGDGRAVFDYIAPAAPPFPVDDGTNIVTLLVTPVGTDYANATPRSVQIRLVPPGVIVAPTGPSFTVTPSTLVVAQEGFFNASASTAPDGRKIEVYDWDFGDGKKKHIIGTAHATHEFMVEGTFTVVLTVTDSAGVSASTARLVKVVAE